MLSADKGEIILFIIGWTLGIVLVSPNTPGCEVGWFGSRCQYQCHCYIRDVKRSRGINDKLEDNCDENGNCINNATCSIGWFGPACQYADLVSERNKTNSKLRNVIADNNDKTCRAFQNFTVIWDTAYPVSWMRLIVRKARLLNTVELEFTTETGTTVLCDNNRSSIVSKKSLDVYCDLPEKVTGVTIRGQGVGSLCSLYISGGRNLVLKQNTSQSSNYDNIGSSDKAVDGNRNGEYDQGSCTCTKQERLKWNVILPRLSVITRYLLFIRNQDQDRKRLRKFVLTSYNQNDQVAFTYIDNATFAKSNYSIVSSNTTDIVRVQIRLSRNLTLCEVEIYGDSVCESQTYGRECEHSCNCNSKDEACFVSTGGCPSGCAVGYDGEACDQPCKPGRYGARCGLRCSSFCLRSNGVNSSPCHHIHGTCPFGCQDGYEGPFCVATPVQMSVAVITGVVFATIIIVILVTVTTIVICMRSRNIKSNFLSVKVCEKGEHNEPDGNAIYCNQKEITNATMSEDKKPTIFSRTAIAVQDFDVFLASNDSVFFQRQFKMIPDNRAATTTVAQRPENKGKNRYKNIYAYDHSRVKLEVNEEKNQGDYINASFVQGYTPDEMFIAAQGPTAATLEDFVRMLWETKVDIVVMLTSLNENGKKKCERYWPEHNRMTIGEITITLVTNQEFCDYTVRRLVLMKEGGKSQTLTQFHFTAWPDRDVPTTAWGLVDFEQRVTSCSTGKPILVHCSAGIGRTGTFIALRNVMRQAELTGCVDCYTVIRKLRRDRIGMVQTFHQYEFLHKTAQVAMLCIGTTVMAGDIHNRVKILETYADSTQTNMEKEFHMICHVTSGPINEDAKISQSEDIYQNCRPGDDILKDRFNNILPKEYYRTVLRPLLDMEDDYINAVLVPSFFKQGQQILTQIPLPTTTTDFWRLVTQYNVSLIVALRADWNMADPSIGCYLPTQQNKTASYFPFIVRTEFVTSDVFWEQHTAVVSMNDVAKAQLQPHLVMDEECHVTHLQCTCPGLEPEKLLALAKHIRSLRPMGECRTLYMCRNGADYSGLMCVLLHLLDRLDNDQCITVPLVVGAIKAIRPAVIPTLEQYATLYHVLKLYSDESSVYSNFGNHH